MFDLPKKNQFTQGTIFSCGYAEGYENSAIYGLVITARCDAAQNKAPIFNFVPVVALKDWILNDGAQIILERSMLEQHNTRKNILLGIELSSSLLMTKTADEIVAAHLQPRCDADKRFEAKVKQFKTCSAFIQEATDALASRNEDVLLSLIKRSPKHLDSVIKELAGNKLLGYYLLRSMPRIYDDHGTDHVVLLREIHHIPNTLAKKIVAGIGKNECIEPLPVLKCPRYTAEDDYCAPVARLKSPWMEHLMQSLTLLFSRIGVEDVDAMSVLKSLESIGLDK
jgi:hypothetical protein